MNLPLHIWNKKIVSWVESNWWKPSKATKNSTVGWQGYGTRILGRAWFLFIAYLKKVKSMNSNHYMALLDRSSAEIKKKRPHMQEKKVLFHLGNPLYHKSMKTMVKLNESSFELLPHSRYSPDMAPSDYWPFVDLRKMLDWAPMKKWLQKMRSILRA